MDLMRLTRWRDAALVLLAMGAFVLGLVPALLLYWSLRVLPKLRQQLLDILLRAREVLCRVQRTTGRVGSAVAKPVISLHGAAAGLRRVLQCLGWRCG